MKSKIRTFIFAYGLMLIGVLISGTVFSFLWQWFVVPLLLLPPLSILEATGIGLTFSFLSSRNRDREPTVTESLYMIRQTFMVRPLTVLTLGYIFKILSGL